ncbi:hypothetical protein PGH47_21690 [Streptomyces sp. HUAS 31]|uniref:hypothetical protein n=1 Tax=Streptomyces TaxID=1883 RepID=UPI002304D327|nr:hypothetical protein [Streptomyces sp. HUAS 31]WCD98133.1 hypothetical protein PGH47_21690 [Streptomyces sp. HUAS 31]
MTDASPRVTDAARPTPHVQRPVTDAALPVTLASPEATAGVRVRAPGPASVATPVFEGPGPVWPTLGG